MNIQGLEALATLASAVPTQGTSERHDVASKASQQQQEATQSPAGTQQQAANHHAQQGAYNAQFQLPQQMWQQLMASAAGSSLPGAQGNPPYLSNLPMFGQMGSMLGASGNANLQRLISPQQQSASPGSNSHTRNTVDPTIQALSMALNSMNPAAISGLLGTQATSSPHLAQTPTYVQVPPPTYGAVVAPAATQTTAPVQHAKIAPQQSQPDIDGEESEGEHQFENKKLQKRVANRRSAQLSRKRKKQFIEELKDENDGLRRKEQILRSIPDLVVVFDSSGKLWFVSESVNRFLDFTASELEGTSFWNLMCSDSVRLLKAAFMDSLAAREGESDTAPLGEGFWDVQLKSKDGAERPVSLNGVVHFAGDRPECVCSIRPKYERVAAKQSSGTRPESNALHGGKKLKTVSRISDSSECGSSDERCAGSS